MIAFQQIKMREMRVDFKVKSGQERARVGKSGQERARAGKSGQEWARGGKSGQELG